MGVHLIHWIILPFNDKSFFSLFLLKDQFDNLDKHTQWGIDFLEKYAKFVKERIEIEQNYAKQLR